MNEPKYIEVKELKEWVQNWFETNRYYHPYSKSNNIPITELYDILEQMPSALGLCKDCKNLKDGAYCQLLGVLVMKNFFSCSAFEKGEENVRKAEV